MLVSRVLAAGLALAFAAAPAAAEVARYRTPPPAIERVLRAPVPPTVILAPSRDTIALATPLRYPPVADLARPMLRLAGLRIDPATNGIHHAPAFTTLAFERIADRRIVPVALPPDARITRFAFSPDGRRFAAANATRRGTELWTGEVATGRIARVPGVALDDLFGAPFAWTPDGRALVARVVDRLGPPPASGVASRPAVQENGGRAGALVTYEDLLASPHDEALFTYYATARLARIDVAGGTVTRFGPRGLYTRADVAPDGRHVLVERLHAPYSYVVPWERFPRTVAVTAIGAADAVTIADLPLADAIPADGVPTGPRDVAWEPDRPASLVWVRALDGGDPRATAEARDAIERADAPAFRAATLLRVPQRTREVRFLERDPRAIVRWYDRTTRLTTTALLDTRAPGAATPLGEPLRDGDRYGDPGRPATGGAEPDAPIVHRGDAIWLVGEGWGPDGRRPFVDRYDLATRTATRLFRSELLPLVTPLAPLDADGARWLMSSQSPTDPPNAQVRDLIGRTAPIALTHVVDPTPELRRVQRRLVTYTRPDGIALSFTLYLPPGYREGERLPAFLWAYPLEYNDRGAASQNGNSTQTFVQPAGASEVLMALAGYAVLDNAAIPIVGDPRTVNDTYVEQLVAGATAAISEAARLGVVDPERVAVGGHSYGAFMTMNLLAHTRLFRAGIARSGAYNRTLTPFGFQSERRSYWEATRLYTEMSPFTYANSVKDPVLMIHGEADDNTGTFPIQSERMYAAITGNGGTARLVMLPYEAHGYVGRESIETTLAEMVGWLDRWVKRAPSR